MTGDANEADAPAIRRSAPLVVVIPGQRRARAQTRSGAVDEYSSLPGAIPRQLEPVRSPLTVQT